MQIVLLATGEVPKLLPLTEQITTPLLPVLNRPVISYHLDALARQGYRQVLVTLFHLSDMVEHYCGDGTRWHIDLAYLLQRQALGTAGSLKRAERLLHDTFLVLPADALFDLEIAAAVAFHQHHGGVATMILSGCQPATPATVPTVALDAAQRVILDGQGNATCDTPLVTGAYIFDRAVLDLIPAGVSFDCLTQLLPVLVAAGHSIYGYVAAGYWNGLTTFQEYQAAQAVVLQSLMDVAAAKPALFPVDNLWSEVRMLAPGIWSGVNTVIHPQAKLTPPLLLGADCRVGPASELGPHVVLGNHVFVDQGATIQQSTVLENSYVGRLVNIRHRIVHQDRLIDQETATCVQITDRWLLGYAHPTLASHLLRRLTERLIALSGLILLLPLLLLLGLLVLITSPGGLFTIARRIGVKPAPERSSAMPQPQQLRLLQLRTLATDGRPTPVGLWLERFAFHRLPELWNVVCGEIALVGVKPLLPEEAARITEEWQQVRYRSPAGFTGLWFTQFMRDDNFDALCVVDSYQAATASWRQAFAQLWQTPFAWWRRLRHTQAAYGAVKATEVRSQPVVQRPPIGW